MKNNRVHFHIVLDSHTHERLRELAFSKKVSIAQIIRFAVNKLIGKEVNNNG